LIHFNKLGTVIAFVSVKESTSCSAFPVRLGRRPGKAGFGDIKHAGLLSGAVFNDALEHVDELGARVDENRGAQFISRFLTVEKLSAAHSALIHQSIRNPT